MADRAGGCRASRRGQGKWWQVPHPAARLQGQEPERLHRCSRLAPTPATHCFARISSPPATPTLPRRSHTANGSSSIRCRKRRILRETKFVDAIDILFDSAIPYDTRFFQTLERFVQREPWLQRDKVMIDHLKTIGIEKGKPFKPDANAQKALNTRPAKRMRGWI